MRLYSDILDGALARALDWSTRQPTSKSVLWRRISIRQQELFALAGQVNPEYFHAKAVGTLDGTAIDLMLMEADGVKVPVLVTAALIETMAVVVPLPYAVGDKINIIAEQDDPDAYLAPRARIRGHVLEAVGEDLDDVTHIRLLYAYRSATAAVDEDGTSTLELDAPFDELLVVDLARHLARLSLELEPDKKAAIIAAYGEEEKELLGQFADHLENFLSGMTSRGKRTQGRLGG